jgi:hypothetical protein
MPGSKRDTRRAEALSGASFGSLAVSETGDSVILASRFSVLVPGASGFCRTVVWLATASASWFPSGVPTTRRGVNVFARGSAAYLMSFSLIACGPVDEGPGDTGGASSVGSETGGSTADGSETAGAPAAGGSATGGKTSGGTSPDGGTATGVGGSSGGSSDASGTGASTSVSAWDDGVTEGCPAFPTSKLLPYIGAFFYGPDPGPCRVGRDPANFDAGSIIEYDTSGRPVAQRSAGGEFPTTFVWDGDLMVAAVSETSGTLSFAYEPGALTTTNSSQKGVFELDPRGYPRRYVMTNIVGGAVQWVTLYQYADCRIVGRKPDPDVMQERPINEETYTYDAEGHLVLISDAEGTILAFDYSCWE